jgi:hypothetical protein
MAPERRADIAAVVLRAFVAGKFIITYKAGWESDSRLLQGSS